MRRSGTLTLRRGDGKIVCESVRVADSYVRRMKGLLGEKRLAAGEGLVLRPSWSIHTWFMRFPIDVVFLDPDQVVIRIEDGLRPYRTASFRGAREVVELHAGECARRGLRVGDRVSWAPRTATEGLPDAPPGLTEPRGSVVVASSDPRFAKLARFLLDGEGVGSTRLVTPDALTRTVDEALPDVVVLDAGDELGRSLRLAHSVHARSPATSVVLVGDAAAAKAPRSARVYDKWQETDTMLAAVSLALDGPRRGDRAPA